MFKQDPRSPDGQRGASVHPYLDSGEYNNASQSQVAIACAGAVKLLLQVQERSPVMLIGNGHQRAGQRCHELLVDAENPAIGGRLVVAGLVLQPLDVAFDNLVQDTRGNNQAHEELGNALPISEGNPVRICGRVEEDHVGAYLGIDCFRRQPNRLAVKLPARPEKIEASYDAQ